MNILILTFNCQLKLCSGLRSEVIYLWRPDCVSSSAFCQLIISTIGVTQNLVTSFSQITFIISDWINTIVGVPNSNLLSTLVLELVIWLTVKSIYMFFDVFFRVFSCFNLIYHSANSIVYLVCVEEKSEEWTDRSTKRGPQVKSKKFKTMNIYFPKNKII